MTLRRHFLASALAPIWMFPTRGSIAAPRWADGVPAAGGSGRPEPISAPISAPVALPPASGPYALPNTFVHPLPDPVSGRRYEVWVDLPPGVAPASGATLPAVFVTDAPYAFPMVRALRHRVGQRGRNIADFVLVGLAGPAEESAVDMRNRDYTPSDPLERPSRSQRHYGGTQYGGGPAYLRYLAEVAVPAVSARYGLDPRRRVILGHSYGALLAAQALFTRTPLFSHYILGSPSYWFDDQRIETLEAEYARSNKDLPAQVFQYVGGFETLGQGPRYNSQVDMIAGARHLAARLQQRRYPSLRLQTRVLAGEDHLTVAPAGATAGLLWALPGQGPYTGG